MNVAFFSEMARFEGSAYHMLRQARWMAEHGHTAIMFSSGGPLVEEFERAGVRHFLTPSTLQNAPLDAEQLAIDAGTVARECERHNVQAILAAPMLPYTLAQMAVGSQIPVYFNVLSSRYFACAWPKTAAELQRAAAEGRIISTTIDDVVPHGERFGFDPALARLAPVPIDLTHGKPQRTREQVRRDHGIDADAVMVFTACRLDFDRAPFIGPLANAVERLRTTGRKVQLVVAGDGGAAAHLRERAPASTIFVGMRNDLADFMHAADVFCGEGSIIADAALARLPVVLSCALVLPGQADRAFSIFGLQSLDHLYWSSTNVNPPTDFAEALLPLVDDAALRARFGEAAYELATTYFSIDRYMPWFLSVVAGQNPPSLLPLTTATVAMRVRGGGYDGLEEAASILVEFPHANIGLVVDEPIPWLRLMAMPLAEAQSLARAVRHAVDPNTVVVSVGGADVAVPANVPEPLASALRALPEYLPPTSSEPRFAIATERDTIALAAIGKNTGVHAVLERLSDEHALLVWIPEMTPAQAAEFNQIRQSSPNRPMFLIDQPIAWSVIGRLFAAISLYADSGEPEFRKHRLLAQQYLLTGVAS